MRWWKIPFTTEASRVSNGLFKLSLIFRYFVDIVVNKEKYTRGVNNKLHFIYERNICVEVESDMSWQDATWTSFTVNDLSNTTDNSKKNKVLK